MSRPEPEIVDQLDDPKLSPCVTAEDLATVDQALTNHNIREFVESPHPQAKKSP